MNKPGNRLPVVLALLLGVIIGYVAGLATRSEQTHGDSAPQRNVASTRKPKGLTKEQWKQKVANHFPVSVNQISGMISPDDFKAEIGTPDRTQTVGDNTYWYYNCSDGVIQMVIDSTALSMYKTMIGAQMNDY